MKKRVGRAESLHVAFVPWQPGILLRLLEEGCRVPVEPECFLGRVTWLGAQGQVWLCGAGCSRGGAGGWGAAGPEVGQGRYKRHLTEKENKKA